MTFVTKRIFFRPYLYKVKKVFIYSFLILFLLANFNQLALYGLHLLNQDYITEKFCINKDEPALKCRGKCHMNDVLAETKQQKKSTHFQSNSSFILPVYQEQYQLEWPKKIKIILFNRATAITLKSAFYSLIFHPPQGV